MGPKLAATALGGLTQVRAQAWDRLVPSGEGGLRHGYLSAWEQVELDGLRSRPLVARRPGTGDIVAAMPGYHYDLDVTRMIDARAEALAGAIRRAWPRFGVTRIYEVGCPTAISGPLLRAPDVDAAEAASALMREALAEADRTGADVVILEDFACPPGAPGESVGGSAACGFGFEPLPIMPTVWLELGFDDFDGYLAAMRAQYRRRARKVLERSAHLDVEQLDGFGEEAPELARLSREMFDRAREVKREVLGERFFWAASALDELSLLALRRPDRSIAAFGLLLDDRPCLRFLACGFEREAGERDAAYFRLLYEIVRAGIEGGFRHVDFGVTTLAPKLDTGGVPVPLVAWMRHRNRVVQRAFAAAARRLVKPECTQPRKVFKEPVAAPALEAVAA